MTASKPIRDQSIPVIALFGVGLFLALVLTGLSMSSFLASHCATGFVFGLLAVLSGLFTSTVFISAVIVAQFKD